MITVYFIPSLLQKKRHFVDAVKLLRELYRTKLTFSHSIIHMYFFPTKCSVFKME